MEVNDVFCDVSGYSVVEVIGQPHRIVRHPDMPQLIFRMLWDNLKKENNFVGVIKNLSKSGEYYWVITDFMVRKDMLGNVTSYIARRKSISKELVENHIAPLYETLSKLERVGGMELSSRFFKNYLDKNGMDYIDFIIDVMTRNKEFLAFEEIPATSSGVIKETLSDIDALGDEVSEKRKSFFERLFS